MPDDKDANSNTDTLPPLTARQLAFLNEYMIDRNAKQAAIRAGYAEAGASTRGYELTHNPNVARHIEARATMAAEKSAMTAAAVLRLISLQAQFDLSEIMVDVPGKPGKYRLLEIAKWSDAAKASVLGFKLDKDGAVVDVKLADKQAALRDLGRSHGLFRDVIEELANGDDAVKERMRASEAQLEAELNGKSTRH